MKFTLTFLLIFTLHLTNAQAFFKPVPKVTLTEIAAGQTNRWEVRPSVAFSGVSWSNRTTYFVKSAGAGISLQWLHWRGERWNSRFSVSMYVMSDAKPALGIGLLNNLVVIGVTGTDVAMPFIGLGINFNN